MKLTNIRALTILAIIFITSNLAYAQGVNPPVFYEILGKIESISGNIIRVSDLQLIVSPTVKVNLSEKKKGKFEDLNIGDFVGISTITINKRKLVDTINLLNQP